MNKFISFEKKMYNIMEMYNNYGKCTTLWKNHCICGEPPNENNTSLIFKLKTEKKIKITLGELQYTSVSYKSF